MENSDQDLTIYGLKRPRHTTRVRDAASGGKGPKSKPGIANAIPSGKKRKKSGKK
jgi:hypothetical protein